MKWEELKAYRPLAKEDLRQAFKDFTKVITENLHPFGFSLHGRKLIVRSDDLLHIIHIDTRGSWSGISEYFEIEIALVALSDISPFVRGFELIGSKKIEGIVKGIRNHYRITQEYHLLADFLTRKIMEEVFPYFARYHSSKRILEDTQAFSIGNVRQGSGDLILFCELQNRINIQASGILNKIITFGKSLPPDAFQRSDYFREMEFYQQNLSTSNWMAIEERLEANRDIVLKKLKIKP